jgi:hypothetical protein
MTPSVQRFLDSFDLLPEADITPLQGLAQRIAHTPCANSGCQS